MGAAMILAAGRGERLRPLTDTTPKALIKVAGKTLIERHLRTIKEAGIEDVVINVSHLGERIRAALGDGRDWGVRIQYSQESEPALETAGGICQALPLLGPEPFWAINTDVCTDYQLVAPPLTDNDDAHLVLVDNPPHHPDGDFHLKDGRILETPGERLTFAGIGLYHPRLFEGCTPGHFPLAPLLRAAAKNGRVRGEHHRGQWLDIGTPERLEQARISLLSN